MITVKGGGGVLNNPPVISELQTTDVEKTTITISYKVTDKDLQIVRHYISVSGVYDKKEITSVVGYDKDLFTYTITGLTQGTEYTIQVFASDGFYESASEAIKETTDSDIIVGFSLNENDSNPDTCITYTDAAVGVTPASGESLNGWANMFPFKKMKLVALKGNNFYKEIRKDDMTKYVDGTDVGTDVDVMLQMPKFWMKKTNTSNGYKVQFSNKAISGYDARDFEMGGVSKDFLRIASYYTNTENKSNRIGSAKNFPIGAIHKDGLPAEIKGKGSGFLLETSTAKTLEIFLFMLAYKSIDSEKLGLGKTMTTLDSSNGKGWISATEDGVTFLGLNHFITTTKTNIWGLQYLFDYLPRPGTSEYYLNKIDTYILNKNTQSQTKADAIEGTIGTGWLTGSNPPAGYISKFMKTTSYAPMFRPIENEGSATTYYKSRITGNFTPNTSGNSFYAIQFGGTHLFDMNIQKENASVGGAVEVSAPCRLIQIGN